MGIFIEDLLNLGNLIDAEIEIKLTPEELSKAYGISFNIEDGVIKITLRKRFFFLNKTQEIRLLDADGRVRKDRETSRQWVFFKLPSKRAVEDIQGHSDFTLEDEYLAIDIMRAVMLTETYEKIPKQFREKLLINRYKIGKSHLSVFFRFEK